MKAICIDEAGECDPLPAHTLFKHSLMEFYTTSTHTIVRPQAILYCDLFPSSLLNLVFKNTFSILNKCLLDFTFYSKRLTFTLA